MLCIKHLRNPCNLCLKISFLEFVSPQLYHPFGMLLLCRIVLRLPYPFVFQFVRKELLFDKVTFIAVCIFIFLSVAQLLHQFGRSIAQMQGDRQITG